MQRYDLFSGVPPMAITVEAVYENGTLKLERPLPLQEHEKVRVTVERHADQAEQYYGLIGWKGDAEAFDRLLAESEEAEGHP
jgi:predicted DNA-binding antitoxin AbrB/MazE fold protein